VGLFTFRGKGHCESAEGGRGNLQNLSFAMMSLRVPILFIGTWQSSIPNNQSSTINYQWTCCLRIRIPFLFSMARYDSRFTQYETTSRLILSLSKDPQSESPPTCPEFIEGFIRQVSFPGAPGLKGWPKE